MDSEFASELAAKNNFWIDFGRDNYAGVTWQNTERPNGNKLFIEDESFENAKEIRIQIKKSAINRLILLEEIGLLV